MMSLQSSGATDVGLQRSNNEDAFVSEPKQGIWVVADGMGGHAAGEVASLITIETILKKTSEGHSLNEAIRQSHKSILQASKDGVGSEGMGSTVVALQSQGSTYRVCWVGDSRAYIWNQETQELKQISTDHSYVQMLYQSGAISAEELQTHPERNIITQCLGSLDLNDINVDCVSGDWPNKALILLCSDGLTDLVSDDEISQILQTSNSLIQSTKRLIDAALAAGGKDNITVQVINGPSNHTSPLTKIKSLLKNLLRI